MVIHLWVRGRRAGRLIPFILGLLLVVCLTTVSTVDLTSSQTSPNQPSGDICKNAQPLCEEIRQEARNDLEAQRSPRGDKISEDYVKLRPEWQANPVRAKIELRKIYEKEYTKQETAKKQDPRELFKHDSWLVAFLSAALVFLGALLSDALKTWIKKVFKAIDDWIYARFAGSRLFRGVALQRYRIALAEKYKELHIPFRTNRPPLDMSQVYVPLKVASTGERDQIDAYRAIAQYRRLMVKGPPGSGKSMLLKHLALSYATGKLVNLAGRPVPILLELHRLNQPDLNQEKLIQALVDVLARDNFPKAERFVRQNLKQGTLLLLLDGLDEVNSNLRSQVVRQIKDLLDSYERPCRLVVTCRTAVYQDEFASETEQTLEVVEFTDQQIRRFLSAWEPEMPREKSIDQLIQTLRDRPRIMELARNPLLLTIIAYLYTDTPFVLPHSRAEFYRKATDILLDQWQRSNNHYRTSDKSRVLQHLALYNQGNQVQQQKDRRSLDYTTVLEQIRQILPGLNLKPESDTKPILDEIVERSGLFLRIDNGERYQFAHLTIQEYFAAVALLNDESRLISEFTQSHDDWREVVKLWCGLAGNSTSVIQAVYALDAITGFESLADAQEVEQSVAESIITAFKHQLGTTRQDDAIATAFGAVAADTRPRGQSVFDFLKQALMDATAADHHPAIAQALSMTNLPQAAAVLATAYVTSPAIPLALTRMGDVAVPELADLAGLGHEQALQDLYEIATPDAATALLSFIWDESSTDIPNQTTLLTSSAAWYLAALIAQPDIEAVLREYPLTAQQRQTHQLEWIWSPFEPPSHSSLPVIAGRLAYLLKTTSVQLPIPCLDPRLVLPLSAVELMTANQVIPTKHWDAAQAETLLEQPTPTSELDQQCRDLVNRVLEAQTMDLPWKPLLLRVPPRLQLALLYSLLTTNRQPTQEDWRNLFRPINYDLRTGWHYRCVLLIAALLSVAAIAGAFLVFSRGSDPWATASSILSVVVLLIFWLALWKGIDHRLEPTMFIRLGLLGPITYWVELRQLFQTRLVWVVWAGIDVLHHTIARANAVGLAVGLAGAFALALTGADADAFASAFTFAFTFAFAVAGAVAVAGAFAGTIADADAVADADIDVDVGAFAFAVAVAVAFVFAGAFAVAVTFAFAGAGAGLGAWYHIKSTSKKNWLRWLAVLALPWFCSFPILVGFGTVALHQFLNQNPWLPVPLWQPILLIELGIGTICMLLWRRGTYLDARARNPLQHRILVAALQPKQL